MTKLEMKCSRKLDFFFDYPNFHGRGSFLQICSSFFGPIEADSISINLTNMWSLFLFESIRNFLSSLSLILPIWADIRPRSICQSFTDTPSFLAVANFFLYEEIFSFEFSIICKSESLFLPLLAVVLAVCFVFSTCL